MKNVKKAQLETAALSRDYYQQLEKSMRARKIENDKKIRDKKKRGVKW